MNTFAWWMIPGFPDNVSWKQNHSFLDQLWNWKNFSVIFACAFVSKWAIPTFFLFSGNRKVFSVANLRTQRKHNTYVHCRLKSRWLLENRRTHPNMMAFAGRDFPPPPSKRILKSGMMFPTFWFPKSKDSESDCISHLKLKNRGFNYFLLKTTVNRLIHVALVKTCPLNGTIFKLVNVTQKLIVSGSGARNELIYLHCQSIWFLFSVAGFAVLLMRKFVSLCFSLKGVLVLFTRSEPLSLSPWKMDARAGMDR